MKNHYVYQIRDKETNQFYIGSRSCECEPENDSYMGSPKVWEFDEGGANKYILLKGFSNRDVAFAVESALIKEFINNELNENYHIPNEGFHTLGRPLSEEHKQAISDYFSKPENKQTYWQGIYGYDNPNSKEVLQFDLEGNFIREWGNARDIMREHGYCEGNIYMCCRGEYKQSNGYQWKYKYDENGNEFDKESVGKYRDTRKKPVYQLDYDTGEIINEFESIRKAGRETGIFYQSIKDCCKGKLETTGGYLWKYKYNNDSIRNKRQNLPKKVLQIDIDSDEVIKEYDSINKAGKCLGKNKGSISHACNGNAKTAYGYKWRFKDE